MKPKVIKSMFMLVISMIFCSLCITFAWFTGVRMKQLEGTGIQLTNMTGELYYYNGNFSVGLEQKNEWKGYRAKDSLPTTGETAAFSPAKKDDPNIPNPFTMNGALPGSRFLFYIKGKVNQTFKPNETVDVRLQVNKWLATNFKHGQTDAEKIYLTSAIHIYSSGLGTTEPTLAGTDAANATSVLTWANTLKTDDTWLNNNGQKYKDNNKFTQSSETNTGDPVQVGNWTVADNQERLYPFILEVTNDPNTYYSTKGSTTTGEARYMKDFGGNSNVYQGLEFTIQQLALTHYNEIAPQGGK